MCDSDFDEQTLTAEIDTLSLRMLLLMNQYINLKLSVQDFIKSGSFHLAKSRYIMGNKSVSVLQLPTENSELSANTKVVEAKIDDEITFSLTNMSVSSPEEEAEDLRSRNVKDKKEKGKRDEDSQEKLDKDKLDNDEDVKKKPVMQDPIKWFGVLVPQNMRMAQMNFSRALETSIEIANVQLEISSVRKKYDELTLKKKNLINERSKTTQSKIEETTPA